VVASASPGSGSIPRQPGCWPSSEGAVYEWREQTAAVRAVGGPEEPLAAVLAMVEGLREARRATDTAPA
jgi:hypothetical protein